MKGDSIGELEELILLVVGILYEEAYGVTVFSEVKKQTGREVNISAIHVVMNRLEEKGLLNSFMGGATNQRGGRRKKFYKLTGVGRSTLEEMKNTRERLFDQLRPASSFSI
ncbi:MAG: PadR family transcriptional regulator [Cyclobacteriaceae bacterium]